MKRSILILVMGLLSISFVLAQKVDSIMVEQNGDFVKIEYKIVDSKPGEVYKVRVLCSINSGLNTELRSVSGDMGDNVQGGKPGYFVIWDVLKDVDELKSAEFIVRAELVRGIADNGDPGKDYELTAKWAKKWFYVGPAFEFPGSRAGVMLGIMGDIGVSAIFTFGKYAIDEEFPIAVGVTETIDDYLEGKNVTPITVLFTVRIISRNSLQMHLMAGIDKTRVIFLDVDAMNSPFHEEKVFGPAGGLSIGAGRVAFNLKASRIDPGQVEKEENHDSWIPISPFNYFTASLGVRF